MSPQLAPEEPQPLGEVGRLTAVVLEPAKAYADIAARPRFWPVLLLLVALATAYMTAVNQRIGWETVMRTQIEKNTRVQNLPPEQIDRIVQQQTRFMAIAGYPMAVIAPLFMVAVCAGIYLFVFRTLMSTDMTYKQMVAIYSYASVPGIISSLLGIVVMFLKAPEDFDIQNPLAFNIGAFLPEGTSKVLVSIGTSIDAFMLWALALIVIGVRAAAPRLSAGSAVAGVFGPWLLWIVAKAGWAAIFG